MKLSATFSILFLGALVTLPNLVQSVESLPDSLQQVDTLRVLKAASDSELNTINSAATEQAAELKQLKRRYANLLAEKEQLISDYHDLERELVPQQNKLGKENMALEKQMKLLISEKLELRTQIDKLDKELRQAQKEKKLSTAALRPQLTAKENSLPRLETGQQKVETAVAAPTADKNNLQSTPQDFNQQFAALQQKLVEQLTMAQQVKDDLQQQLQQSQTDLAVAAGQIKENEERLQKISAEKAALTKQLELLTAEKTSLLAQVEIPTDEPPKAQDLAGVEKAVKGWTQAWSEQKVEDYLSFYSADFRPTGFKSRLAWEEQRRTRLKRPKFIIVGLSNVKFAVVDPTRSRVTFTQAFKSNTYTDTMRKQLEMQKEAGGWKILREEQVK